MKIEFSRQILKKYSNIEFNENPSSGSRVVPNGQTDRRTDGRTDGRDETNNNLSQFCERV